MSYTSNFIPRKIILFQFMIACIIGFLIVSLFKSYQHYYNKEDLSASSLLGIEKRDS